MECYGPELIYLTFFRSYIGLTMYGILFSLRSNKTPQPKYLHYPHPNNIFASVKAK